MMVGMGREAPLSTKCLNFEPLESGLKHFETVSRSW